MAAGASRAGRWTTRIVLIGLLAAAVVAAVAGITYATGVWGPLSHGVQAEVRRAIVGYELAKGSQRPPGMVGKRLTRSDKAALQARFVRRLRRFATGPALAWGDTWDYAAALREDEWGARELVGVTGRIVYWDHARRGMDGDVRVRAGVEERHKVVTWDEVSKRAIPQADWLTGVIVYDYTLRQVDGVWKVADSTWWRFYDPATGRLTTGP